MLGEQEEDEVDNPRRNKEGGHVQMILFLLLTLPVSLALNDIKGLGLAGCHLLSANQIEEIKLLIVAQQTGTSTRRIFLFKH